MQLKQPGMLAQVVLSLRCYSGQCYTSVQVGEGHRDRELIMQEQPKPQMRITAVIGLGLLLSTLLIHSVPNMPFIGLPDLSFFQVFAPSELIFAGLVSLVFVILAVRGTILSHITLLIIGITCSILGGIAYLLLMDYGKLTGFVILTACVSSIGNVAMCLVWGRISGRYSLKNAVIFVACGGAVSGIITWIMMILPFPAASLFFIGCMLGLAVCSIIEIRQMHVSYANEVRDYEENDAIERSSTFSDLIRLAGMSVIGLMVFAFIMAVMKERLLETFDIYLLAVIAISVILIMYAITQSRPLIMRNLQLTFIPLFAILLLAVTGLSEMFGLGGTVVMLLVYLLYICAALLTLAELAAVAHAQEFSPDIVFAGATFLFVVASLSGQILGNLIAEELIDSAVVIATMLYAFAVMLYSYLSWNKMMDNDLKSTLDIPAAITQNESEGGPEKRCAEVAVSHKLTRRELEVLIILAEGHGGSYISEVLFISPNTARTHIRNIYRKLGVSTREEILRITRKL